MSFSRVTMKLLEQRIVQLFSVIDDPVANTVLAQLLYLQMQGRRKPVRLYVNSPGGLVNASIAIYDTVKTLKAPVETICVGQASGTAALIVAAGKHGCRSAMRNALFRMTPIQAGSATPEELVKVNELMIGLFSKETGQPLDGLRSDLRQEFTLDAAEAVRYGLIDRITSE